MRRTTRVFTGEAITGKAMRRAVYESLLAGGVALTAATAAVGAPNPAPSATRPTAAQTAASPQDSTVVDARDALRRKDRNRLAQLRAQAATERNPLAMWVEYWELQNRLGEVTSAEAQSFMARWPGSYVEDRFRNDWLLELGRRRDLAGVAAEFPRFRMNDDREVTCYAAAAGPLAAKDAKDSAVAAWFAQREADDGCALLGQLLFDAKAIAPADVWTRVRNATEGNKLRTAKQSAALLGPIVAANVADAVDNPARFLAKKGSTASRDDAEATLLSLIRLAAGDSDSAADQLGARWDKALPADLSAFAWASVARQSALKLRAEAPDQFDRAERAEGRRGARGVALPDEVLGWKARAALRADGGKPRWQQVMQAITAMTPGEQQDPQWLYWKARAAGALAGGSGGGSGDGEMLRTLRQELLAGLAPQLNYYGQLAAEDLGSPQVLPPKAAPPTPAERDATAAHLGLQRALALISIGLRSEGVREWNYSLRGMTDRELLAAAQLACDREVWDRCINTSDRTRAEVDLDQRFPTPHRKEVVASAREIGLDPAYVYGLIRQESRFVVDARSGVGASGLMQLMPATARETAKKIGIDYTHDAITDRDVNLKLGNAYLKRVLDDVGGSQAMAAAGYNAGPGRPRKWRDGPTLPAAVWVENIPFAETRDYVKKVLSNAAYYTAVMASASSGSAPVAPAAKGTSVRSRLGGTVGPRDPSAPPPDRDIP